MTSPRHLAAPIRARLTNHTKAPGKTVQFVLLRSAIARLLYRLSQSAYADRFILKGAMLFSVCSAIAAYGKRKQCDGNSKSNTPGACRKAEAGPGPTRQSMAGRGVGVNPFFVRNQTADHARILEVVGALARDTDVDHPPQPTPCVAGSPKRHQRNPIVTEQQRGGAERLVGPNQPAHVKLLNRKVRRDGFWDTFPQAISG